PPVLAAVAELDARRIPLLVATGRRVASTQGPLGRFGLAPPAVVLNGALGLDLATGARFHRAPFPAHEAVAAYDAFRSVGLSPVVYVDHPRFDVLISQSPDTNPAHVVALGDTAGRRWSPDGPAAIDDLRAAVASEAVLGFSMIGVPFGSAEAAFAVLEPLTEVHLDRSIDFPGLASLTAAPRNQSKWDGVLSFCAAHDIDAGRVLALADGPNDIELLTHAAVTLVPDGSHPSALERAHHVIPAAVEGGWAAVLDHVS
ncbi:MAG: HAD family hydrolase, partial [Microthrixaceae bacterium]